MNGNILIVEDEEAIVNVLASILIANEYIPVIAKNGAQALTMLRSFHPDVVLLDLGLPDMDGIEILKRVKDARLCPVLVVSARDQEQEKVEALDLGADDIWYFGTVGSYSCSATKSQSWSGRAHWYGKDRLLLR